MYTYGRAARSLLVPAFLILATTVSQARVEPTGREARLPDEIEVLHHRLDTDPDIERWSWGTSEMALKSDACPDTFILYGGPGTLEGQFQTEFGSPDRQGWTGLDRTFTPPYWQVSTFNAETLRGHGPGNHAMWCGRSAEDEPGWETPPGYGNNASQILLWTSGPLSDPWNGRTVTLDFFCHHDTEPNYDFLFVQYDSAGTWKTLLTLDGHDRDPSGNFVAPGLRYSTLGAPPIVLASDDYGGAANDEIRLRLFFQSDFAWSDEDGMQDTDGAAQVDDILVQWTDGGAPQMSMEDFEGPAPYAWTPVLGSFAGDFSKVFPRFRDVDPCKENTTPVMTFIDDGTPPANDPLQRSTGGSLSPNWSYGIPGGWVVNYTGGVSFGEVALNNGVYSPPVAWDLPGTCDDSEEMIKYVVRYDYWLHQPPENGIWHTWHHRYSEDNATTWSGWIRGGYWYAGWGWYKNTINLDIPVDASPTHVQWSFEVWDVSDILGTSSDDATPSPILDNVIMMKARAPGPAVGMAPVQDTFPYSGSIAAGTQAERDALDIPFFKYWASDAVSEDDTRIGARAEIPGTQIEDVRLVWRLQKNPLFEDEIRTAPARPVDVAVDASDPLVWRGEVLGALVNGDLLDGTWSVDLPDSDLIYPGDVLRYYAKVEDSSGRVSTWPRDISGFESGVGYDPYAIMRGLPSIREADGTQPEMLFVLRGKEDVFFDTTFGQLGLIEGVDFDRFVFQRPWTSTDWNGIGAAGGHGANADQLAGYRVIYFEGRGRGELHDGTDGSDDLGVLTSWRVLPGERHLLMMCPNLAERLTGIHGGQIFLETVLGAELLDTYVHDDIGNLRIPVVRSLVPEFGLEFAGFNATCSTTYGFDAIRPIGSAMAGHGWVGSDGLVVPGFAATVLRTEIMGDDTKRSILAAFGLNNVSYVNSKAPVPVNAATVLLGEFLDYFGGITASGTPGVTQAPSADRALLSTVRIFPNPFNPRVRLEFELGRRAHTRVAIYTLRGERVCTLIDEVLEAGPRKLTWDGTDATGSSVASGVYLYEVEAGDQRQTGKLALLR